MVYSDESIKRKLIGEIWAPLSEWYQKFPLTEDVSLRGVPSLAQAYSSLDFASNGRNVDRDVEVIIVKSNVNQVGYGTVMLRV